VNVKYSMRGYSSAAIWDGPDSLVAVLRLRGSGSLSIVRPKSGGKPIPGSQKNCLRIRRPDKTSVAHPGDLVVTDMQGRLDVVHGFEWAAAHGAYFMREEA